MSKIVIVKTPATFPIPFFVQTARHSCENRGCLDLCASTFAVASNPGLIEPGLMKMMAQIDEGRASDEGHTRRDIPLQLYDPMIVPMIGAGGAADGRAGAALSDDGRQGAMKTGVPIDPARLNHFKRTLDHLTDPTMPSPKRMDRRCQECENVWFCVSPCPRAPDVPLPPWWKPLPKLPVLEPERLPQQTQNTAHPSRPRAEAAPELLAAPPRQFIRQPEPTNQKTVQSTWDEVAAILPQKVRRLDRTKFLVDGILRDEHITLHLCTHTYHFQLAQSMIATIPRAYRFKIGITQDPSWRFYEAQYAYTLSHTKRKDGVNYEHMLIIHLSHSREVSPRSLTPS